MFNIYLIEICPKTDVTINEHDQIKVELADVSNICAYVYWHTLEFTMLISLGDLSLNR